MMNRLEVILLLLFSLSNAYIASCQESEIKEIEVVAVNRNTKAPIEGVHAFFINSTFGSVSTQKGEITLFRPSQLKQDLIFTHIGYESLVLSYTDYKQMSLKDTVYLNPHGIDLDMVVVEGNRNRTWKKRYKRFKKAFLGEEKAANKCKIGNPETLQFEERGGNLIATATDLISIQNNYLGYDINFHLESFTLSKDGSLIYHGQARFIESQDDVPKKVEQNRKKAFDRSSKNFYQALINDDLEARGLSMSLVRYHGGNFIETLEPNREQILSLDTATGNFHITFSEFLQVTNKNIKEIIYTEIPGVSSGLESRRFNSPKGSESGKRIPATSQVYKVSESIVLDKYGNVLNPESVREYGFWAKERMATMLPFDYGWEKFEADRSPVNDLSLILAEEKREEKEYLQALIYGDQVKKKAALHYLGANWNQRFFPPLMELLRMTSDEWLSKEILTLLQQQAGVENLPNYYEGLIWLWGQEKRYDENYADFKAEVYRHVDPSFSKYFANRSSGEKIRLDEVVWGGVKRDGIPPLRSPNMISANEAEYLNDGDIVFGVYINGEAKAYPKRILAWHEFFQDNIGGAEIAGVYCTLCGTVIAYDRNYGDEIFDLGTSGFLYRSNKLMYDKATYSLWSTIEGRPVIGPLAEQDITLTTHPVVTTTWGSWKKLHPNSKVLSLQTGYDRNYAEGEAYKDYFNTDALMFPVPLQDGRLKNKQEVMVVRVPGYQKDPVAFSVEDLKPNAIVHEKINGQNVVILCDEHGVTRAFGSGDVQFKSYKKGKLRDTQGGVWMVNERELKSNQGRALNRLPSHNIFWFAWLNAYPNTRLIK